MLDRVQAAAAITFGANGWALMETFGFALVLLVSVWAVANAVHALKSFLNSD